MAVAVVTGRRGGGAAHLCQLVTRSTRSTRSTRTHRARHTSKTIAPTQQSHAIREIELNRTVEGRPAQRVYCQYICSMVQQKFQEVTGPLLCGDVEQSFAVLVAHAQKAGQGLFSVVAAVHIDEVDPNVERLDDLSHDVVVSVPGQNV